MSKHVYVLDELAKQCHEHLHNVYKEMDNETYGHLVLSHGFMEFLMKSGIESWIERSDYWRAMRPLFDQYCKINNVAKDRIEEGWKQWRED